MNINIRAAVNDDLPQILTIINDAIANTTAVYDYEQRTPKMLQQWFNVKTEKQFPVIVATNRETILGYATYGTFRDKAAFDQTVEHSVYVRTEFLGNGIGGKLLTELISLAKLQDLHVMIGAIDASNSDSINFHKKFGFTECGFIREVGFKFGRRLDMVFMQLMLKS